MVGQSSISLVLVHVLEWVLSRQGWEKRYKKEKEGFLDHSNFAFFHLSFIPMRWCFDFFFFSYILYRVLMLKSIFDYYNIHISMTNSYIFILMIKAWTKIVPWPRVRYHELLIQIMYSFWDRFRNFLHKLHELFCQFIIWTNWVNSGKFMVKKMVEVY